MRNSAVAYSERFSNHRRYHQISKFFVQRFHTTEFNRLILTTRFWTNRRTKSARPLLSSVMSRRTTARLTKEKVPKNRMNPNEVCLRQCLSSCFSVNRQYSQLTSSRMGVADARRMFVFDGIFIESNYSMIVIEEYASLDYDSLLGARMLRWNFWGRIWSLVTAISTRSNSSLSTCCVNRLQIHQRRMSMQRLLTEQWHNLHANENTRRFSVTLLAKCYVSLASFIVSSALSSSYKRRFHREKGWINRFSTTLIDPHVQEDDHIDRLHFTDATVFRPRRQIIARRSRLSGSTWLRSYQRCTHRKGDQRE